MPQVIPRGALAALFFVFPCGLTAFAASLAPIPLAEIENRTDLEQVVLYPGTGSDVTVYLPPRAITADELLVVFNNQDPVSIHAKDAYVAARNIPTANIVELSFDIAGPPLLEKMLEEDFNDDIKTPVNNALMTLDDIQAIVVTWKTPWAVTPTNNTDANSLSLCLFLSGRLDKVTGTDFAYIGSDIREPETELGYRPVMMLAAETNDLVDELIADGLAADNTFPLGDGYFMRTSDSARSELWPQYVAIDDFYAGSEFTMTYLDKSGGDLFIGIDNLPDLVAAAIDGDFLTNTSNMLFYFTGAATIPPLFGAPPESNSYVNGAFAQHVTSGGGTLTRRAPDFFETPGPYSGTQMSALEWTEERGIVGSYGTVAEPTNLEFNFVSPLFFLPSYIGGNTLIQATWKSVANPTIGAFIGDPLARPYGWAPGTTGTSVKTSALRQGAIYTTYTFDPADLEEPGDPPMLTAYTSNITASTFGIDDVAYRSGATVVYVAEEMSKATYKNSGIVDFGIGCAFEVNDIQIWCLWPDPDDGEGELWMQTLAGEQSLITDRLIMNAAATNDGRLYWIENVHPEVSEQKFAGELKEWDFTGNPDDDAITLFQFDASNLLVIPVALRVTDSYIVWAVSSDVGASTSGASSLFRQDRVTGVVEILAGPTEAIRIRSNVPLSLDVEGDRVVFLGSTSSTAPVDVYLAEGTNPIQNLTSTTDPLASVSMSGDHIVWRQTTNGDTKVMLRDGTDPPVEIGNVWGLPGDVTAVDVEADLLMITYDTGSQNVLTLHDLAREVETVFTNPEGFEGVRISSGGLPFFPYFSPGYAIATADKEYEATALSRIFRYSFDIGDAFDATVTNKSIPLTETLGFYVRPSEAYLYDGVASYEATMADGTALIDGIALNEPRTDPLDPNNVLPFFGAVGDLNRDTGVNTPDLGIMKSHFFSTESRSDLNNDGVVNPVDLGILRSNFFGRRNLFFGYIEWDPSVTGGTSFDIQVTMTLNGTASVRKRINLSESRQ